jgi:hypothetical protein
VLFASAAPLRDLGAFVFGDHALKLHEQLILGRGPGCAFRKINSTHSATAPRSARSDRRTFGAADPSSSAADKSELFATPIGAAALGGSFRLFTHKGEPEMNTSMARRIRCAALLIYAIDRQYGEQRERSEPAA